MDERERKELEGLIDAIHDPATKERYGKQLRQQTDLEGDGLLDERLPLEVGLQGETAGVPASVAQTFVDPPLPGAGAPTLARTYVFQWFREGQQSPCEQLVVHTAGTEKALALFEQNAASGTLVHAETITPRCEILSLDADDCRVCFGAGKVTVQGKQRSTCKECAGSGKVSGRTGA